MIEQPHRAGRDLERAAAAYSRGDLGTAERHCAAALRRNPNDFNAIHLMGVVLGRKGRHEEALTHFDRAAAMRPGHPDVLRNRGSALVELGRLNEALADYDASIAARPDHAPTLSDRGLALLELGKEHDALAVLARALTLDPENATYANNLGRALMKLDRTEDALACYLDALTVDPRYVNAKINAGTALIDLFRYEEAIAHLDEALALQPDNCDALILRAAALQELERKEEAIACFEAALIHEPNRVDALMALGACLRLSERFAEGDLCFEKALALSASPEAAVQPRHRSPELRQRALADAWCRLATVQMNLQRWSESIESFRRALSLRPDFPEARWNLACALLILGDFEEGWKFYEHRRTQRRMNWTRLDGPEWDGRAPIEGKRVFLYAEQALGDTLQFARFAGLLAQRGAIVTLGVHKPLASLLRTLPHQPRIVVEGEHSGAYDYHAPLMSLPMLLDLKASDLAGGIPYLFAEDKRILRWRERLPAEGLKVGLSWQGSAKGNRSIPLAAFEPLAHVDGVRFISLHREAESGQIAGAPEGLNVLSLGSDLDAGPNAFLDTAAVIMNLDLVITCDTSIGHLAGALGQPVWRLLKNPPDWRWMLERQDTPWYPQHRLLRQSTPGRWDDVMDAAAATLRQIIAAR